MKSHCFTFVCDSLYFRAVLFLSFISFVFNHLSPVHTEGTASFMDW